MSIFSGTFQSFSLKGEREQLLDRIWSVENTEVPFQANIGRVNGTAKYVEWQTDTLSAAAANAQIEGDDITSVTSVTPTTRVGARMQILRKTFAVSGTAEAINKAGRNSEIAYQVRKNGLELRRDLEKALTGETGSTAGSSATAAKMGGFESWITSNDSRQTSGTTGVEGGFSSGNTSAPTDGTQRTFTETLLKAVLRTMADNGAKVDGLMLSLGSFNKQTFSGFAGIADQRHEVGSNIASIIGAADVYVSDFGRIMAVYNAHQRGRTALLVDKDMASVAYLRNPTTERLAKTGDAEKRMLITEATLVVNNEKAHGVVADLTTS